MGRLQHLLASFHLATPAVRASVIVHSFQRGQNKCKWNTALFDSITAEVITWSDRHWSLDAVCAFMPLNLVTHSGVSVTFIPWFLVSVAVLSVRGFLLFCNRSMIFALVGHNTLPVNCLRWMHTSVGAHHVEIVRRDALDHFVKLQLIVDLALTI